MKIAISSTGNDLESFIDRRFERCPYFIIYDTKTNHFESISNLGTVKKDGTSSTALDLVLNNGIKTVITGDMSRMAFKILSNANKKIITGIGGKIYNVINELRINQIEKCPLCGSKKIIRDYDRMKVLCINCQLETSGVL